MPVGQVYATNVPQTTLSTSVTSVATTITVNSSSGWPATPFTAVLDLGNTTQEPVDVSNVSGVTWTIARAIDSTTGFAHTNGATVTHSDIGRDFREARAHIDANGGNDSTGKSVHGLAGNVVGTTDAQTLTNKTLTAPNVNDPVIKNSGNTLTLPPGPDTLVALAAAQTLTNKTLTAPTINGAGITGVVTGGAVYQDVSIVNSVTGNEPLRINALAGTTNFLFSLEKNSVAQWQVGASGNLVGGTGNQLSLDTAAAIPVIGPTLQSYTPSISGTGAAVGNGTLVGGYVKYGRQVFVEIYFILGSTSSFSTSGTPGTTTTGLTLPLPAANYVSLFATVFRPSTPGVWEAAAVNWNTGSSTAYCFVPTFDNTNPGSYRNLNSTIPSAQAIGDVLYIKGTYQATT